MAGRQYRKEGKGRGVETAARRLDARLSTKSRRARTRFEAWISGIYRMLHHEVLRSGR
jgi:hypothetical protein